MHNNSSLTAISPIDGRYGERTQVLMPYLSEYALIKHRVFVETEWLSVLGSGILPDKQPLSVTAISHLSKVNDNFSLDDAQKIKDIERKLNHDLKAVEVWLHDQLPDDLFGEYTNLVHFGLTSEDANNLAYALMLRGAIQDVILPSLRDIHAVLDTMAADYAGIPMLAHTHGQPASPVTVGKELRVYAERLANSLQALGAIQMLGKCGGATGGHNAARVAYPEVGWQMVAQQFVESLGLVFNPVTTQIEPHDWIARVCNELSLCSAILTDLATDMWHYISLGYFTQKVAAAEVGSSTMPHKINPINFENAEGNFGIATALFQHFAVKLPKSRLQRDLSDSTALRALGEAFAHTLIAHAALKKGLEGISPNTTVLDADLEQNWAVLTEAVQTVMRRYNLPNPYETIKAASRGKEFTKEAYVALVTELNLPEEAKESLLRLTPRGYTGYSGEIARKGE